ncbi:ArnT family glycosyltransferase [Hymenobacter sp. DG25A]|uniref:ArnT family glycosyltransferase n=1 Tax=Hymenobacter sp. DG25A TaxID=1385663 RepID=UPI0006BC37A3|nr:hypothetical protein [Hymenobacter sp. DG25A]ALD21081.1 hypothetical protein AM218_07435 [Hymenobacter sp. DG25A]
MKDSSPRLAAWTLLSVVVFIVAYFFFTHEGLYDYDDYHYARLAHELATGTFQVNPDARHLLAEPFRERLLVFAPVALLYRLFGVGIYTTTLWPLLCTLGSVVFCWALYRRREPVVAAGAMVLLGLHYFMLTLSNFLYPDNILMFGAVASAAALLWGRRNGQQHPALWGIGFAALTLAAFLAKETIVFYLPFYLSLLLVDLLRRQHQRFWLAAVGMGVFLLIGYLSFYYAHTGDALYRLHRIEQANVYFQPKNYLGSQRGQLLARLTWQPLASFISSGMGVAMLLALVAAFSTARKHPEARFWLWLALSSVACFWWGSTSLAQYNPITLTPRMMTPLLPPLCLAAGFGLREALRNYRYAGWLALGLLGCALWLHNSGAVVYAGTAICFAGLFLVLRSGRYSDRLRSRLPAVMVLAIAAVLAIRPLYFMAKPSAFSFFDQQALIKQYLPATTKGVVFVDEHLLEKADFYYGFTPPPALVYRRYESADSLPIKPGQSAWLLVNGSTLTNPELTRQLIRYSESQVLAWFPHRQLVAQKGKVHLYQVFP